MAKYSMKRGGISTLVVEMGEASRECWSSRKRPAKTISAKSNRTDFALAA